MAQITINRTKQKQTVQQKQDVVVLEEQIVSQQQSLEMMRVLLGASVGCLAYLRSLLPDECFVDQRYGTNTESFLSYALFTTQDEETSAQQIKDKAPRIKRLQRGSSRDADRLLDWLELGVFDALEKKYLKSVQFIIYLDESHPEIIYECYTFSFAYAEGEPALSIADSRGRQIIVKHAKTDLQSIMRKMIMASQNLAPLPDRRFLTVRLYYNKSTPKDYNPPLFRRDKPKRAVHFYPEENERKETFSCGQTHLNHHAVGVKVSSICQNDDTDLSSAQPAAKRVRRTFIPADFDVEVPMFLEPRAPVAPPRQESFNSDPSQILATQQDNDQMDIDTEEASIDERIAREKQELLQMFKLENAENNLNDTQPMPEEENLTYSRSVSRQVSVSRAFESINLGSTQRMSDSEERTSSLTPTPMDFQISHTEATAKRKHDDQDIVECECGSKEDEGFMLCCEKCDTWRHGVCYGFNQSNDDRIPKVFRCHRCSGLDSAELDAMSDLCQFRRILNFCWDDNFLGTAKKMADDYDIEPRKAPGIARRLLKEGFFAQLASEPLTWKEKKQGKRANPHTYQVVKTIANQRQVDKYMNPFLHPEDIVSRRNKTRTSSRLATPVRGSSPSARSITAMRVTRANSNALPTVQEPSSDPILPTVTPFENRRLPQEAADPTSDTSIASKSSKFVSDARAVRSATTMSTSSNLSSTSTTVGVPDYGLFEDNGSRAASVEGDLASIFPKRGAWN